MSDRHIPNVLDPFDEDAGFMTREQREEVALGLEQLANWIRTTRFPIPRYARPHGMTIYSSWIQDEGFIKRVSSAIRLIGGRVEKAPWSSSYSLVRKFAGGVQLDYSISREAICTPVTKTVPKLKVVPVDTAREAELRRELDALETIEITVPEEVTEYECPPSLLAKEAA
jgi:hypothetical protein